VFVSDISWTHGLTTRLGTLNSLLANVSCAVRVQFCNIITQGRAMAQVASGPRPGQSMWDLWWTKWHWDRFFLRVLRCSPVNISFHRRSPNSYHMRNA
jgi:hypothetical protein